MKKIGEWLHRIAQRCDIEPTRRAMGSVQQLILLNQYRSAIQSGSAPLRLQDVGLRIWSQNEEDGILLFIFAAIGMQSRIVVELCAGDGVECNSANLLLNHGWTGLLCDGDEVNVKRARAFYSRQPETWCWPPQIAHAWLTCENVNTLLAEHGISGSIDLLSIDVDGIDYWLWKAISEVSPRVVVIECNHLCGPDRSITVPYDPHFRAEFSPQGSDYAGASLPALVRLGSEKGYRFVGTNRFATNAFFVRRDIAHDWLPEIDLITCFDHPRVQWGITHRWPRVENREWIQI